MRNKAQTQFEQRLWNIFLEEDDFRNDFFHGETQFSTSEWFNDEEGVFTGISFNLEDHYGGEGQGEDYWTVYKFTDDETQEVVYLKFDGWYQSYNGADFNEMGFVTPKEKTVTVYD